MKDLEIKKLQNELESYSGNYHLIKLSNILNYSVSSSFLFLLSFFFNILLIIASVVAVLFIPYLIYVLWIEKKYSWFISIILLIVVPAIISLIFLPFIHLFTSTMILLGIFYLCCYVLRFSVSEWIREKNAARKLSLQKLKQENDNSL